MGVATLLGDAGRMEEGLQFMDKAVEVTKGENPHVYNNLGAYLLRLGQSINLYSSEFSEFGITVVSRVSTHRRLNITRNFGPHGRLPGI